MSFRIPGDGEWMKVRELRDRYEQHEVELGGWRTPRSKNSDIQAPTTATQEGEARRAGRSHVTPKGFDEIIWETPLDERVYFLTPPVGRTSLLAKNIEVEVREV